jgi:hypothetical protein
MTPEDMAAQDRIYARSLADFNPMVVNAACEEWSTTKQFWPELSELLALVREHVRLDEVARRPRLAPPEANPTRRENLADDRLLAAWRENDRLGAELAAAPEKFVAGHVLAKAFAGMRGKRFADRPDLAARYYGSAE